MRHSLEKRPSLGSLQDKGIVKGAPGMSPRLVQQSEALMRAMARDRVTQTLEARPSLADLESQGILVDSRSDADGCAGEASGAATAGPDDEI